MASSASSPGRKNIAVVFALVAIGLAVYMVYSNTRGAGALDSNSTIYVDAETGQSFSHKNVIGEDVPVVSPYTGKNTGYPGVPCYWTADGKLKKEPTWVVMNESLGKSGPTFCPDCGRLVDRNAQPPGPDSTPPPTKVEWMQHHSSDRQ